MKGDPNAPPSQGVGELRARRLVVAGLLALACSSVPGAASAADEWRECVAAVHREYQAQRRDWLNARFDLALARKPGLAEAVAAGRAMWLAEVDLAGARFEFLVRSHPDEIRTDSGLASLVGFQRFWTRRNERELAKEIDDYAVLLERKQTLRRQVREAPGTSALAPWFETEFPKDLQGAALIADHEARQKPLSGRLRTCNELRNR